MKVRNAPIDAYIFDMDGTLVDNCGYHVKAWRQFSRKYGHELTEREILDWMGATGAYYVEQIFGRPLPREQVDELCREKEAIYRAIYRPKLPEGLREWLDYAHRRGIKCALATGGPKENVDFILDSLDLRRDFEVIVDATMYELSKPDPECFLKAAELLGVPAERCRVYEDAVNGIRAAKAAGMQVVALTFTNPRERLEEAAPDRIVGGYTEFGIYEANAKKAKTAEDLAAIEYLDRLRDCRDEAKPVVPLAAIVKVVALENVPKANDAWSMAQVEGKDGAGWRLCVPRDSVKVGKLYLFVSGEAALPADEHYRRWIKIRERVLKNGCGVKVRAFLPHVPRSIYRNNSGLLMPTSEFPELKGKRVGTLVAALLHIEKYEDAVIQVEYAGHVPPKILVPTGRGGILGKTIGNRLVNALAGIIR